MKNILKLLAIIPTLLIANPIHAALLNIPTPLNTAVKPPMTVTINGVLQLNGAASIIRNNTKLIQLGKALFWDTAVGSDGMSCASCHFNSGADSRTINQVNPGFNHNSITFDTFRSGHNNSHSTLSVRDFPMWETTVLDPTTVAPALPRFLATVIDDVVSSAGTLNGSFVSNLSPLNTNWDTCTSRVPELNDPSFNTFNLRRVEPRNTPTTINATFNVRNFWDGRANRVFNGVNPFGLRDTNAKVWMNTGTPTQVKLEINNASLASQAVGPVLSDLEMSCGQRTFDQVGNKLVGKVPLATQTVSRTDSVLGPITRLNGKIQPANTYQSLITAAFRPQFTTGVNGNNVPLTEANFTLFFGMAVQAYEDTLRSGQSKFDLIPRFLQPFTPPGGVTPIALVRQPFRTFNGAFVGLTRSESRGLDLFMGQVSPLNPAIGVDPVTNLPIPQKNGKCILCHNGPEFTSAAFTALAPAPGGAIILPGAVVPREFLAEPMPFAPGLAGAPIVADLGAPVFDPLLSFGTYDLGFYDIGVTPCQASGILGDFTCVDPGTFDHGLGGSNNGHPIAFSKQWENAFLTLPIGEKCAFEPLIGGLPVNGITCIPPVTPDIFSVNVNFVDVNGVPLIMTPILAPARTDGSFKTPSLRNVELTAPYFHNGSAKTIQEALFVYNNGGLFAKNPNHHPEIIPLGFNAIDIRDVTNFLLTLTDPRVKFERAPFDHPSLAIPNGHTTPFIDSNLDGQADDNLLSVPPVGSTGLATAPLTFVQRLAP